MDTTAIVDPNHEDDSYPYGRDYRGLKFQVATRDGGTEEKPATGECWLCGAPDAPLVWFRTFDGIDAISGQPYAFCSWGTEGAMFACLRREKARREDAGQKAAEPPQDAPEPATAPPATPSRPRPSKARAAALKGTADSAGGADSTPAPASPAGEDGGDGAA